MKDESGQEGFDYDEIFMILLLAVVIPVMLLATNLDLRRMTIHRAQQSSPTGEILPLNDDWNRFQNPDALIATINPAKDSGVATIIGSEAAPAANLAQAQPPNMSNEQTPPLPRGNRETSMMAIDFSLADLDGVRVASPMRRDASITVSKVVLVGDRKIGNVDITIESEGRLLLEAGAVRALLGQQDDKSAKSLMRLPEQGLVSFAQLRDVGIDLRYHPNEDAIRLNP